MRLQLGDVAGKKEASPPPEGWHAIESRLLKGGYLLAVLIGLAVLVGLWVALGVWVAAIGNRPSLASAGMSRNPWLVTAAVLVLFIPLHESFHLLGQPGWGGSERSVVVLWPAKLRFGVYYEGCMSRRRWLAMRLAPFVLLSLLPVVVLALLQFFNQVVDLEVGLSILMIVNALGSGADLLAALAVLTTVPSRGQLCFQDGRGYWRPGEQGRSGRGFLMNMPYQRPQHRSPRRGTIYLSRRYLSGSCPASYQTCPFSTDRAPPVGAGLRDFWQWIPTCKFISTQDPCRNSPAEESGIINPPLPCQSRFAEVF